MKKIKNNSSGIYFFLKGLGVLSLVVAMSFIFVHRTYYEHKIPVANLSYRFWIFSFVVYYVLVLITRGVIYLYCKKVCNYNIILKWLLIGIIIIFIPAIAYFVISSIF